MGSDRPRDAGDEAERSEAPAPTDSADNDDAGHTVQLEFRNPLSDLPEVARNLILSAKSIIAEKGFDALTLNRLAADSGENKAMTAYYFGNKAGLIAAVLDSVIHDEYLASEARTTNLDSSHLAPRLVAEMRTIVGTTAEFRVFYELLPRVLRDDMLRTRLLPLYRWYWTMKLEWLGLAGDPGALDDPDLQGIARLLSAIIDGLAIQSAIEPHADLDSAYHVLATLLEESLPAFVAGRSAAGGTAG